LSGYVGKRKLRIRARFAKSDYSENAFGKNIEDAWAAFRWVHSNGILLNINPSSLSLSGISAGGLLTLVVQLMARDYGIPVRLAIPAVPVADNHISYKKPSDSPFLSYEEMAFAPSLPFARMDFFMEQSFRRNGVASSVPEWWISPLRAKNLENLGPTFLITAEIDPLRDEGEAYGMKLVAAGNIVTFRR
jgi:acetyl esterase/lipase